MLLPAVDIRTELSDDGPVTDLYPDAAPFHYQGATDGALSTVSVFLNEEGPHWHYIGFGLRARFPFELTFRLAADATVPPEVAPNWPVEMLEVFAEHATKRANGFEPGHYLCLPDSTLPLDAMRCAVLVADPQLDSWLQIVPIHEEELPWVSGERWRGLIGALEEQGELLVTRPGRAPVLPEME